MATFDRPLGIRLLLAALCICCAAGACRRTPAVGDVIVESTLTPPQPVVGMSALTLRLLDAGRRPISGASLRVEGHMAHPGMAPVQATATERAPGVYEAELQFTMRGDWILLVTGALANGAVVNYRIDVKVK